MDSKQSLFLVDGSSLAFRSFFALFTSGLSTSSGLPTSAIYGFFASLFDLIEKRKPHSIAVCFDMKAPTFRHEAFDSYKANRDEMPDDLAVQWPLLKEGLAKLEIPVYELAGYEADDLIGTVAKQAHSRHQEVIILTGDQDAFQLLDGTIQVLMPTRDGLKAFGHQEVFEKLGVYPEQVIDYKGLCGDTSDNIPGVKGIGPKTAVQLLSQFGTMENIYENLDKVKTDSLRKKLIEGRESAFSSKSLATIRLDVPFDFDFDHCQLSLPNVQDVLEFFRNLEMKALLKRLPKVLAMFNNGAQPEIDPALLDMTVGKKTAVHTSASLPAKEAAFVAGLGQEIPVAHAATSLTQVVSIAQSGPAMEAIVTEKMRTDEPVGDKTAILPLPAYLSPLKQEPLIVKQGEELKPLLAELENQSVISLSFVGTTNHPLTSELVGVAVAWSPDVQLVDNRVTEIKNEQPINSAYIPLHHKSDSPFFNRALFEALSALLRSESPSKVVFDSKAALNICSLLNIELKGIWFDPLLGSYIEAPDENHKLGQQARRCFDYPMLELSELTGSGKKAVSADMLACAQVAPVAAESAMMSLCLASLYANKFDSDQMDLMYTMDLPMSLVLARMEQTGIALDVPYFKQLGKQLQDELARLEAEIFLLAGHSFNINSPLQLQKILFEELNLPTKSKTKSGFSTDASVLESLIDEHAIIAKILDYRQVMKLNSTYVEALPRQISLRDNRLHGEFNQTVTSTGRLSSTNPNLQNIPIRTELGRNIRRGFIPSSSENFIVAADYSQIELRLLAHMSGDENLIDAFQRGEDIHTRTARLIFDLNADQVTSDHRRVGKTLNFALIYQQGAFSTGHALGIPTKQAQLFIEKYFAGYPRVKEFMNKVIEDARQTGYVQTLWGRRRYFRQLNNKNEGIKRADERAACNAPLQGSAADLIKLAMIKLDEEITSRQLQSKLILQVHDELVLDVPAAEVEEIKQLLTECMVMNQPLKVPLQIDIGVAKNWKETK